MTEVEADLFEKQYASGRRVRVCMRMPRSTASRCRERREKGGEGRIFVRVMCFRVRDLPVCVHLLIAAQVKRRSEDSSLERNHELLEWLAEDDKSEKRSDAQIFGNGPTSAWHMKVWKIVSK